MINRTDPGFASRIIELETVGSTNGYAGELLKKGEVPEGTVVFAHRQTAGKGYGTNTWESEPGKNLTFTLVLKPGFLPPERQFNLNKAISLGVLDFAASFDTGAVLSLKWPNDIYAGNHKLGGILINNTISGSLYIAAVAGIGLNVNQVEFNDDLPNPVSLTMLTGKTYSLHTCLDEILACLSARYKQLQTGYEQVVNEDYKKNLLGFNRERHYSAGGEKISGRIRGVDEFGQLLLEVPGGTRVFSHNEIEYLWG